jgi:hypothetical protein
MAFISGRVNRNLSNALPKDYFPDILAERGKQALTAQLIPTEKEMWEVSAYRDFLEKRRALLAGAVNKLLAPEE